jgi:hypothetical protein
VLEEIIQKAALVIELKKQLEEQGFFQVYHDFSDNTHVQTRTEVFLSLFNDYEIVDRKREDYPYELVKRVDGIGFFTLLSKEEYQSIKKATEEVAQTISQ